MLMKMWGIGLACAGVQFLWGALKGLFGFFNPVVICWDAAQAGLVLVLSGLVGILYCEYKKSVTFEAKRAQYESWEQFLYFTFALNASVAAAYAAIAALAVSGPGLIAGIFTLGWLVAGVLATGYLQKQGAHEPFEDLFPMSLGLAGSIYGTVLWIRRRKRA